MTKDLLMFSMSFTLLQVRQLADNLRHPSDASSYLSQGEFVTQLSDNGNRFEDVAKMNAEVERKKSDLNTFYEYYDQAD